MRNIQTLMDIKNTNTSLLQHLYILNTVNIANALNFPHFFNSFIPNCGNKINTYSITWHHVFRINNWPRFNYLWDT